VIALVASTCCGSVGDLVIWSQVVLRAGDTRRNSYHGFDIIDVR